MIHRIAALGLVLGITLAAVAPDAQAGVVSVSAASDLTNDATIDWGLAGADLADNIAPFSISILSSPSLSADVSVPSGTFSRRDEGASWGGNFAQWDKLLLTTTTHPSPLSIVFSTAVAGVGAQIMTSAYGTFDGIIRAYDGSDSLIGSFTRAGLAENGPNETPAIFIGLLSDTANIKRITFDVSGVQSGVYLAINGPRIQLEPGSAPAVPLPSAVWMGLGTLAGLALLRRRRRDDLV